MGTQIYKGYNGQIAVEPDALILSREGAGAVTSFGRVPVRRISLDAISGSHFKAATRMNAGFLQLLVGGDVSPQLGVLAAAGDVNTVMFRQKASDGFSQLHEWLQQRAAWNKQQGIDPASAPYDPGDSLTLRAEQRAAGVKEAKAAINAQKMTAFENTIMVGTSPSGKALQVLRDHSIGDESPWLIIGNGTAGVLAAYDDRLMILKVGAMTGFMAGSTGGGRVTTFPYVDITGLEYNAGFMGGVLEVLTPSYSGTANKDYWRGGGGPNADDNSPWKLSNTLPLPKQLHQRALPQLNELRRRISDAKRPQVHIAQTSAPGSGPSLADEIRSLAELHSQGILDDDEFRAAKQAVMNKQSPAG